MKATMTTRGIAKYGALTIETDERGALVAAYSYSTCLAVRASDGTYVVNTTKYSSTTTRHQNKVRKMICESSIDEMNCGIERGTSADQLLALANKG